MQSLSDDRRPSMTRECDERMWNLAYRLARSGEHRNYQAIEWELQAFGYPQARQLLYHERVHERLDGMCAEVNKESGIRCSFTSEKSTLLRACDLDDGKKILQPHR
jgi:hypothetical protein